MAISSQKLLPGSSVGGAIKPIKIKTSSLSRIRPISGAETAGAKTSDKKVIVVKTKVIEIDKLLKGSVVTEKKRIQEEKRERQKAARGEKEGKLESKLSKQEKKEGGLKVPKLSFLDRMKNFIKNIVLGFIIVRLIQFAPLLKKILPLIGLAADLVSNVVVGIVDGLGTFLSWGFKAYDDAKEKLKSWGGESAVARLDELGDALGNLFNAIAIVGMVATRLGPGGTKNLLRREAGLKPPKPTLPTTPRPRTPLTGRPGMGATGPRGASRAMQKLHGPEARAIYDNARENGKSISQAKAAVNRALRKGDIISKPQKGTLSLKTGGTPKGNVMKGGLSKAPKRLATKFLGKAGMKAVKGIFGKIPILGPIVVAVASLLAGEPIGQALFKAVGAALGGFLGTFIPIPVIGTMLGETLGTFVGDLLYSLILGGGPKEAGEKLMNAIKTAMDVGGLVLNFFKEGFGRFFKNFPTVDVPDTFFGAIQKGLAFVFPFLDNDKDGMIKKLPNLSILFNPIAMITELIPHAAASFFPGIFGAGGTAFGGSGTAVTPKETTTEQPQSRSPSRPARPQQMSPQGRASGEITKKGNAIYLHWTAGNYNSTYGPYHTVFTGDGTRHLKTDYAQRVGHTYGRNSNSVGLSLAANPDIGQWPTEEQRVAMAKEAARIAKGWGWSASDINMKKVMTHGEAGSNVDGVNAHTNYGPFGRGRSDTTPDKDKASVGRLASVERWDLDKLNSNNDIYGSGGDEMRNRIRGFMRMGGSTKGKGLYMMAEEGKEFVIDADSTRALQGTFPGLLRALNKAEGDDAIDVLRSYADYEMAEVVPVVITKPVPVPTQMGKSKKSFNQPVMVSSGGGSFQDTLYKGG